MTPPHSMTWTLKADDEGEYIEMQTHNTPNPQVKKVRPHQMAEMQHALVMAMMAWFGATRA